ncbi:hypothetical protein HF086_005374 [Spodoptera exigua]|uniref:Uncharacterized protein n=1 Tax=Spodoptera exigua TaxID=7107 RepID=A0A922MMP7_SPOEX|nr:hypothetical protein HF086_005374 [Spodoptera exigua]
MLVWDFVKSTIASYKTTAELIDAVHEIDPSVVHQEPLHEGIPQEVPDRLREDVKNAWETATKPDVRHD